MKRFIATVLLLAMIVSVLGTTAFATTKSDLLSEMAKSPVYKYIKVAVENAARTVEVTDEQAAQLLPIVQKGVALISDKGPSVHNADGTHAYSDAELAAVMACIDEVCAIMNFHYTFLPSKNPLHPADVVFYLYDANNTLIFQYDGDVVENTAVPTHSTTLYLGIGVFALLAAMAAIVVFKKRSVGAAKA